LSQAAFAEEEAKRFYDYNVKEGFTIMSSEQQTETIYERIRREARERDERESERQRQRQRQMETWKQGETKNAQWNK
jgi:hypothetical protein